MLHRLLPSLLLFVLATITSLNAQDSGFPERSSIFRALYAGKYEARIGGARESERDKLRLDIGGSLDMYRWGRDRNALDGIAYDVEPVVASFGVDFFTWTRLRSAGGFKFPVEAVDYYFGVNGALTPIDSKGAWSVIGLRTRVAHISAHLVDGDPSFTDSNQAYFTYSREFIDLTVGLTQQRRGTAERAHGDAPIAVRPYVGAQFLFHTIPDTLGRLTPYAGVEAEFQPIDKAPFSIRAAYEWRLNTELETISEHSLRLGLRLGRFQSRGVLVEAGYYSGRSHYGQHFSEMEEYGWLGFGVEL